MEMGTILGLVLGNAAFIIPLFLWSRAESRADYRHLEESVNANLIAIREEIKDFHGRLCAIEEKSRWESRRIVTERE